MCISNVAQMGQTSDGLICLRYASSWQILHPFKARSRRPRCRVPGIDCRMPFSRAVSIQKKDRSNPESSSTIYIREVSACRVSVTSFFSRF
jgi:hypothetical protein